MKAPVKSALLALAVMASAEAHAGLAVVVNAVSYHVGHAHEFNQRNPGVGFEYTRDDVTYAVGEYRNSCWKHSNYITVAYTPFKVWRARFGGVAGIVSGYPDLNKGRPGLMVAGVMRVRVTEHTGVSLLVIPPVRSPLTLGLQLRFGF